MNKNICLVFFFCFFVFHPCPTVSSLFSGFSYHSHRRWFTETVPQTLCEPCCAAACRDLCSFQCLLKCYQNHLEPTEGNQWCLGCVCCRDKGRVAAFLIEMPFAFTPLALPLLPRRGRVSHASISSCLSGTLWFELHYEAFAVYTGPQCLHIHAALQGSFMFHICLKRFPWQMESSVLPAPLYSKQPRIVNDEWTVTSWLTAFMGKQT